MEEEENDVFSSVTAEEKPISPKSIVVIHPGSKNLRIGRADDAKPHNVLHAIARRRKPGGDVYWDSYQAPAIVDEDDFDEESFAEAFGRVRGLISALTPLEYLQEPDDEDRVAFNCETVASKASYKTSLFAKEAASDVETVLGNEILMTKLADLEKYNIHFPWRRGDLNLHEGCGGSLSAVMADLRDIWRHCVVDVVGIPESDIRDHRAVLVVPDIYDRLHVKLLVRLLLEEIGFQACFVLQDHVAATFGSATPQACVVDVGDQKTSISCVEDGVSLVETRVRFGFGGADMSALFLRLFRERCGLDAPKGPFAEFEPFSKIDHGLFLNELKENYCHADMTRARTEEHSIAVPGSDERVRLSCRIQMGDERMVATLAMFEPFLFEETAPAVADRRFVKQAPLSKYNDPEDPFDANFLHDTRRRVNLPGTAGQLEEPEEDRQMDTTATADDSFGAENQEFSLHKAIVQSIEKCSSDDTKLRMYSTILLVGDGLAHFPCIDECVAELVRSLVPENVLEANPEAPSVIVPEGNDESDKPTASTACWKGAAILASLDVSRDLWIPRGSHVKVLREKVPFVW